MHQSITSNSLNVDYPIRNNTMCADEAHQLRSWLIAVAVKRDNKAFANLFTWFAPKILRFGVKRLNSEVAAQELLQNTMTKVWRKSHLFDCDKGAATTWVYTIMRNVSFDMLRKIQSQREDLLSEDIWPIVDNEHAQEDTISDHLMNQLLAQHLNTLPVAQREVISGIYFQDLSQEQVSEKLNIPLGTVKSRLRLGLHKLKEKIGENS